MDLVLTLLIGLLIFYLLYKKFYKKKVPKKEEYTDPVQTVIDEMKKKNSMDTLGEYFYVTLSVGYRNNPRVKKAYEDQEARILYGETLDKLKSFTSLADLNVWWNTRPIALRKIPYIVKYKKMIADGLRFAFLLSDESNKDKLILLFENSPLNKNPVVVKAYNKRKKELYVPLVDAAMKRLKTGNNGKQDLDYFNQITQDILDFSETDDYKTSWNKISLRKFYVDQLKLKLSNFISGGKPNETGLNTSDKQMAFYSWSTELENYWLRLPNWVREYNKDGTDSMLRVFQFNWKITDRKVKQLYTAELGLKYQLAELSEFHNKIPQRVKMFPLYQKKYKAVFKVVYKRAKNEMLKQIKGAKNRNVLVDFRKRSESDSNYQGFFGIGNNVHDDSPSIITKFWDRYDALTKSEKQEAMDNIKNTVEKAKDGVSVFFELLRLWEDFEKIPTKKDSKDNDVPDPNYAHHNWISRLHKDTGRFSTSFSSASKDTNTRSDTKDTSIYNVYIDYLNQYKEIEYKKFSDSLDITVGLGSVAGLNNITSIFTDNYFRDFIFKNQGVYNTVYNKIIHKWNEVFTNFAVKCFPDSDKVVQYVFYKTRWEAITKNKYYDLIEYENVQKIENAYTSNPNIKLQVIKEIGSIVSVIVLEAFINMLPSKFQNDTEIQKAYESRVVQSLRDDMLSYTSIVALLEYWTGIKQMFRNLEAVKNLFHDVAVKLVKKDVIGEKVNLKLMEYGPGVNVKPGSGLTIVKEVILYWLNIMDYKIIQSKPEYEDVIKMQIKYLFPLEVNAINGVSKLTKYWFGSHKLIRKRYRQITWNPFVTRLETLYKKDISGFKHPVQYENLVEYWRALDPIVRGQSFAWPTFFPIFEKLVKNEIKTLKTTGQLEKRIWKHEDLIKYSAPLVDAYGKRMNELRIDEGMAKNVATLTKRGECPADFPYAFSKDDRYLPDSCCNHDPYINNPIGVVKCTNRVDCPYDAGCYMHTNLHCKSNSDCMAFKSLGEELKPGVKCDLLNGSCLYCPDRRQSPIGSPKCQWGAENPNFKHPSPTIFPKIMP